MSSTTGKYIPPQKRPSRGIEHFFKETLTKSNEPTIYNLDEYFTKNPNPNFNKEEYLRKKAFIIEITKKIGDELDSNEGNIIDVFSCDGNTPEDNNELNKIKIQYKQLYLDGLPLEGHKTNRRKQVYPNYYEDLYQKGYKPYELLEQSLGFQNRISNQSDEDFLETLDKRIAGLDTCTKNLQGQKLGADIYFEKELAREKNVSDSTKTKYQTSDAIAIIEDRCKSIYYSHDTLEASERIQTDKSFQDEVFARYEEFFKDSNEVAFARTFLPNSGKYNCFLEDGNINMEQVKRLIIENNRDFRQFVFGFTNNKTFEKIRELRPFLFEAAGMQQSINRIVNCSPLVNWTLLLNLLYCKCAIANSKVNFPVRFLIPNESYTKVCDDYLDENKNLVKEIVLRDKIGLVHLFNNLPRETNSISNNTLDKLGSELVGILTIKYCKYNEKQNNLELRCWFVFIFKNYEKTDDKITNYLSGMREDLFLTNSFLQFINKGSIVERHNVTHSELAFFYSMIEKKQLYVYASNSDRFTLFFSKLPDIGDTLGLINVDIQNPPQLTNSQKLYPSKIFKIIYHINMSETMLKGGYITSIEKIKLETKLLSNPTLNIFFSDEYICGNFYNKFQNQILKITKYNIKDVYKFFEPLYDYLIVEPRNIKFSYLDLELPNKSTITKYKPISNVFYMINELLNKYKIYNSTKHSRIQYIGTNIGFIESIVFNNYKIQNINAILTVNHNYYKNIEKNWKLILNNAEQIYKIDLQQYDDSIYNLVLQTSKSQSNNLDLLFYDANIIIKEFTRFESFYNVPSIFTGLVYAMKHLNIGGTLILNLGSVAYKCVADIYIILTKFFETSDLFYSEIANLYKKTGTFGIFQNFKGCPNTTFNKLLNILEDIVNLFPEGGNEFNITEPDLIKKYLLQPLEININKPATKTIIHGLLNVPESAYSSIMNFNNHRYLKQLIFCYKVLNLLESKEPLEVNLPTNGQIINAILYCQKWNIPYWDKYSSKPFQDKFGKLVLEETFGIHEPILYRFKTPIKLHIAQSITLKLPSGRRITSKSISLSSSKTRKNKQTTHLSISDFLKPINSTIHKNHKNKDKHHTTQKSISYNRVVPLLDELEPIAIKIEQTGYLIDSRRDFNYAPEDQRQNLKWWEVNKQFRYYKHKDDTEKMHLDQLARRRLRDDTISQAWLKMYEIITDCHLVPTNKKGTFHSFHIAEAPGTFINALNNYIHTKTAFSGFEWHAQSLHAKGTRIGDQFGLIKRHPQRWDWGATQDGDITKIRNIKYYKQQVAKRPAISLMTSDAGLAMKEAGYEKVAFASLLAILDILPVGASMVYKILTPIDEPLVLNLIYVAYCNFKELIFYKPVQNNQSREFYIVGKGYLGTAPEILEVFYKELIDYREDSQKDLFNDKYPEAFVRQFVAVSQQLADNYCYTIERNIYYLDNYEHITPEFRKLARDYYDEKNHDWLDRYQPKRIENEVDRL